MERYELQVEGMSCNGCEERITNAAERVVGIRRVDADHETGTVEIAAEEGAEGSVRQAIHGAGYDLPG